MLEQHRIARPTGWQVKGEVVFRIVADDWEAGWSVGSIQAPTADGQQGRDD